MKKEISRKAPGINRGFFVALEGLDGAGKSTQVRGLFEALRDHGLDPLAVKEPTDGQWGRKIRQQAKEGRLNPKEELELFIRDRAEDVAENIGPALLSGRPVIADRYILSNIAYQAALGLSPAHIREANRDFPWPDLIVILETPVEAGLARIAESRSEGADQFEGLDYLRRVKEVFDKQVSSEIIRLDGQAAPGAITEAIIAALKERGFLFDQPLQIIDTHCHLSVKSFKEDREETIARAAQGGVVTMIDVGLSAAHSREVVQNAEKDPRVYAAVGWHPHDASDLSEQGLAELVEVAAHPKVVAFGEIGLDYYYLHSDRETQCRVFEQLLEAATGLDLPVSIHTRDAFADAYRLLAKYAPSLKRGGVIHCFTRDWAEAEAWLGLGFYLSLPGVLTFSKSEELREVAAKIPAERLLVETDSPYLAPIPYRGHRNEPSYLAYHLMAIAEARGISLADAAGLTTANARRLFRFS